MPVILSCELEMPAQLGSAGVRSEIDSQVYMGLVK